MDGSEGGKPAPSHTLPQAMIDVPDIRDYHRINAEVVQRLDQGIQHLKLLGAENQRLLLSRVAGSWSAIVEIEGNSGPELCAGLNAPGLRVICQGSVADGVGSGLIEGKILILGHAGAGAGICQRGGSIVVAGSTGERAGLNQSGGSLVLLGRVASLAAERQSGGTFVAAERFLRDRPGRGRRGGRLMLLPERMENPTDIELVQDLLEPFRSWLESDRDLEFPWEVILKRPGSG